MTIIQSSSGAGENAYRGTATATDASPPPSQSLRPAAFFDFDKTILATDSQGKEAEGMWAESWKQKKYWLFLKFSWFFFFWGSLYQWGIIDGKTINFVYFLLVYRGMMVADLEENGRILYEKELRYSLFPLMIKKMAEHRTKGHAVIVISATPIHLLQPFLDEYKSLIDDFDATKIEVDSATNKCTGRSIDGKVCIGIEKACTQRRLAEIYGLDLSNSFAYSDHHHDLEFLEAVNHPICVNPTKTLEETAKKRDWEILRISLVS